MNTIATPEMRNVSTRAETRRDREARIVDDPRWPLLLGRSRAADGTFFYSVHTTGVYCRPSCGARTPRPENVDFHETAAAAERAGFRACRRCRPDRSAPAPRAAARTFTQSRSPRA